MLTQSLRQIVASLTIAHTEANHQNKSRFCCSEISKNQPAHFEMIILKTISLLCFCLIPILLMAQKTTIYEGDGEALLHNGRTIRGKFHAWQEQTWSGTDSGTSTDYDYLLSFDNGDNTPNLFFLSIKDVDRMQIGEHVFHSPLGVLMKLHKVYSESTRLYKSFWGFDMYVAKSSEGTYTRLNNNKKWRQWIKGEVLNGIIKVEILPYLELCKSSYDFLKIIDQYLIE